MKTRILLSAMFGVLALCSGTHSFARIGESLDQCKQRYGKSVGTEKETIGRTERSFVFFTTGGFDIGVTLHNGKVDAIIYTKHPKKEKGADISNSEIEHFQKLNGGDRTWNKVGGTSMDRFWQTDDGAMAATYDTLDHSLFIVTKGALDRF